MLTAATNTELVVQFYINSSFMLVIKKTVSDTPTFLISLAALSNQNISGIMPAV